MLRPATVPRTAAFSAVRPAARRFGSRFPAPALRTPPVFGKPSRALTTRVSAIFERFTEKSVKAVMLAQELGRSCGASEVRLRALQGLTDLPKLRVQRRQTLAQASARPRAARLRDLRAALQASDSSDRAPALGPRPAAPVATPRSRHLPPAPTAQVGPEHILLGEFSCFLELPVEAENVLETNQPTNQPLITDHYPK